MVTRRLRRVALTLAVSMALCAALYVGVLAAVPGALIAAPNARVQIEGTVDPPAPSVVRHSLRVSVGPPRASLALWVLDPPTPQTPRATLLVLHGIRDQKGSLLQLSRALALRGLRVVLVDHRGHGRSSGEHLTYGVVESRDMTQIVDALAARRLLAGPLASLGFSYGAAVALQHAARDARVRAVISVASFSSLRRVVRDYLRRYVPLFWRVFREAHVEAAIDRAGRQGHFDPTAASPERALATRGFASLIVHGADDRHIPFVHAETLRRAARGPVELRRVAGANHVSIFGAIKADDLASWLLRAVR